MALVEDPDMIQGPRGRRRCALAAVWLLTAALAVGCTNGPEAGGSPSQTPKPSSPSPEPQKEERAHGERVEEALRMGDGTESDDLFVEAGTERVGDGIHIRPTLPSSKSYTLSVVCSGAGKVRIKVALAQPLNRTADCDGVPVRSRIQAPPSPLEVDVEGLPGSSGMAGWRIDELAD
ncbi:hypothetical protein ACFY9Q_07160 [Streptomyces sp. NPDC012389]|uniref:hypothetical protein n=1 Tax=Streptomyces sp. NPDC012389 TaxID=3364830 RepID=UPI0036DFF9B9